MTENRKHRYFRFYLTFSFFLTIILSLVACSQPDTITANGKKIYLDKLKGNWIIVNYWAKWCKPCLEELPELNRFYLDYKDKHVIVFAVSFDSLNNDDMREFAKALKLDLPMLASFPIEKYGIEAIGGLPTTFIIDPENKLIKTLHGPQTEKTLEQIIGLKNKQLEKSVISS